MSYLTHPDFDQSERASWLPILIDSDGNAIDHDLLDATGEIVVRDFSRITTLALERLRSCMPAEWSAECPTAMLNDAAYHPLDETGVRVYLQYVFRPTATENSYHTDSWWVIVLCPYIRGMPHTGNVNYVIEHLGWSID